MTLQTRRAISVAIASVVLCACEPGWFLYGVNDSRSEYWVRISEPSSVRVYALPVGFDGHVVSDTAPFEAKIEVITTDCEPVAALAIASTGSNAITIAGDDSVSVSPVDQHDRGPSSTELRGVCGGTRPAE